MRSTLSLAFVLTLALAGSGCSGDRPAAQATSERTEAPRSTAAVNAEELTPEELGELGARIEKQPDQAKQLLAEKKLDEKSFEAQIRKVTESPAASKRYAEAYKKAKT